MAQNIKLKSPTNRKKKLPTVNRADITGAELCNIVVNIKPELADIVAQCAADTSTAINAIAYLGVGNHTFRAERKAVKDAARTLLGYLDDLGYPMDCQLAALHTKLEAALPFLVPFHSEPKGEPFWPAAIIIHTQSCFICVEGGLEAGTSRGSVAVRITAAILDRLDYAVTPAALELFFAKPKMKNAFKDIKSTIQNGI